MRLGPAVGLLSGGAATAVSVYQLGLLAAARSVGQEHLQAPSEPGFVRGWSTVVLVPAHDEERSVAATVLALLDQRGTVGKSRVVVVADNCSDGTVEVARAAGADVLVRTEPAARGKGQALAWALDRLAPDPTWDVVMVVDADCIAEPDFLARVESELSGGAQVVQGRYRVSNPEQSHIAALRYAGFALANEVEPQGRVALGGSAGLFGSGMAFRRDVLDRVSWAAGSLVEDAEHHAALVRAGVRVTYVGDSGVGTSMPTTYVAAKEQQRRWEGGRLALAGEGLDLFMSGLRSADPARVLAGADLLAPPQSVTAAASLVSVLVGAASRSTPALALGLTGLVAQAGYVLGGLALVNAPTSVYRSLLMAPALVARKLLLFAEIGRTGVPQTWVRTERASTAPPIGDSAK